MKVSWDDDIPNIWNNKKCSKPPTRWGLIVDDDIWYNYKWAYEITLNWLRTVLTIQFLVDLKQTPAKQCNRGCPSWEWCWCLSATMTSSWTDIVFRDVKSAQWPVSFHQNPTRRVANYQSISWGYYIFMYITYAYLYIYIYNIYLYVCVYVWSIIQQDQQGKSCCFWKLEPCWSSPFAHNLHFTLKTRCFLKRTG